MNPDNKLNKLPEDQAASQGETASRRDFLKALGGVFGAAALSSACIDGANCDEDSGSEGCDGGPEGCEGSEGCDGGPEGCKGPEGCESGPEGCEDDTGLLDTGDTGM